VKTAVLGGGLTGVTLARLLHERGDDVTVLERGETIGGLCRSKTEAGFTFDIGGSHIIFSRDAEALSFMLSALGGNADRRKRNTKILYKGRYVKYPFENGLMDLPAEDRFFCINERTERRSSEKQQVRKSLVPKTATDPKPKHHGTKAATGTRNGVRVVRRHL